MFLKQEVSSYWKLWSFSFDPAARTVPFRPAYRNPGADQAQGHREAQAHLEWLPVGSAPDGARTSPQPGNLCFACAVRRRSPGCVPRLCSFYPRIRAVPPLSHQGTFPVSRSMVPSLC